MRVHMSSETSEMYAYYGVDASDPDAIDRIIADVADKGRNVRAGRRANLKRDERRQRAWNDE